MAGFLGSALRSSLPWDRFAVFVRRRLEEAAGIGCVGLAAMVSLALATYHPADPSFTFAAPGTPRNWLGGFGARLSDILFQSVGLAAWIVGLAFLAWGWRFASHRGLDRVWLKLATLAIGLLLAAAAVAGFGTAEGTLVPTGYGGLAGKLLHDRLAALVAAVGLGEFTGWVGIAVAVPAAGLLFVALGLAPAEWLGIGRGIAGAGRMGGRAGAWTGRHAAAAGRAAAGLVRFRRADRAAAPADKGRRERVEPKLGAAAARKSERPAAEPPPRPPRAAPPEKPAREAAREHGRDQGRDQGRDRDQESGREDTALVAAPRRRAATAKREARQGSLALEHDGYTLPPLDLLDPPPDDDGDAELNEEALAANARLLESVLDDFGVRGEIVKVRPGPVVTLYELEPAPGTKSSRVIGLADDIARSMSAVSVRVAVIPGRTVIGIELPNSRREVISLRDILSSEACERTTGRLTLALGKDIGGTPQIADLARMPHLLIAGTTGSGKSVAINSMILSLLYRLPPEQCRFIMIDPKMLELSVYDGIPHLLAPVVTDPGKAVVALRWAVREMETRYRAMSQLGVRNIAGYNARLEEARKSGETLMRTVQTGFDAETGEPLYEQQPLDTDPLPLIVVIVDEMADLMLVAGKDVEAAVQRLSQMARAAGIHLIMATQRPSVDVITGTIKANFPTRISFQVTSKIDSRTILGEAGAEQLLGQGDMLYMSGGGRIMRVHGPFVTDEEVERVVGYLRDQGEPDYDETVTEGEESRLPGLGGGGGSGGEDDALYDQAVSLVCRERKASTSFIQRYLQIGYNRAARIIERMEQEGVVSAANHVGKREVLARDIDDRER